MGDGCQFEPEFPNEYHRCMSVVHNMVKVIFYECGDSGHIPVREGTKNCITVHIRFSVVGRYLDEREHMQTFFLWVSHACRWRAYRANGTQPTCMKRFHILILSHRPATDTLDPINHFQAADAGRTKVNKTETKRNKKRKKGEKNSFSRGVLDDQRLVFVCYLRE